MDELARVLDSLTKNLGGYFALLAGVGTLAMALVEGFKGLYPMRARFHLRQISAWIEGKGKGFTSITTPDFIGPPPGAADAHLAMEQLLDLAIGGPPYAKALFEQPSEKMFGQIQSAVNLTLEFPERYPDFYAFLTSDALPRNDLRSTAIDADLWKQFTGVAHGPDATRLGSDVVAAANQARVRLEHLVARRVDALQIRVGHDWARLNQKLSVTLGFAILAYGLYWAKVDVGTALLYAVPGGFLAPIAKDLVGALSNIRFKNA
jgi:hypothetical protein